MRISVKVVPGASRNQISGWLGDRLKIRVQAPPESGKANKAVIKLIASALSISPREIRIVSGRTSTLKTLETESISESDFMNIFPCPNS